MLDYDSDGLPAAHVKATYRNLKEKISAIKVSLCACTRVRVPPPPSPRARCTTRTSVAAAVHPSSQTVRQAWHACSLHAGHARSDSTLQL